MHVCVYIYTQLYTTKFFFVGRINYFFMLRNDKAFFFEEIVIFIFEQACNILHNQSTTTKFVVVAWGYKD